MQENAKIARLPVFDKVLEDPTSVEELDEQATTELLGPLLEVALLVASRFAKQAMASEVAEARKSGDRLLSREQIAERLHCTVQHISRGWRAGRYPFMLKDGARLVGSEEGLERWIKARTRSTAVTKPF
jgi:hypothetical protein